MTPSLPTRLRAATKNLHTAAERSPFMAALLRGRLGIAAYRDMLVDMRTIYAALEAEIDRHRTHPAVAPIALDGLPRLAALDSDLASMNAGDRAASAPRQAAADYASRLHDIGRDRPHLLVAHAYVRYLGDLNGGQVLRRIVGQSLGAPTAFYEFGSVEQASSLTSSFREALARVPLSDAEADEVVAEANAAFELHIALFGELAKQVSGGLLRVDDN